MEELRKKARSLLESKAVQVVIGYAEGSAGKVRPVFVTGAAECDSLIYDGRCVNNLAVYLAKHEVKHLGKPAIVAGTAGLRALLQLASEHQIADGDIEVIGMSPDGRVLDLPNLKAVEEHVKSLNLAASAEEKAKMERIAAMAPDERWAYWQEQLAHCFKCYACRSACPMCYCTRCTVDNNQPQWIPVAAHNLGNLEWHLMRAMHLAGRCVGCGECHRACPLGLPIHLLTMKVSEDVLAMFGQRAGTMAEADYSLSTFRPDDKENFIR